MCRVQRMRQLLGEMLICCFVVVLGTGGFLAFSFVPSDQQTAYDGWYKPLHGVQMSAAYESVLRISTEVPGGLLVRGLHYSSSILFLVGIVVWVLIWTLSSRFRLPLAVLALGLLGMLAAFGATDGLPYGTILDRMPIPGWYALHLLAPIAMGVLLVISSRQEAARSPRTLELIGLSLALTVLAFWAF